MGGSDLTVVKLGGSYAFSAHLHDWLEALARCAGRVVVVPGGGPFADAVRDAQGVMGFDDRAAHHMALLAMEQFGAALAALAPVFTLAASREAIEDAVAQGCVPVWVPTTMVLAAPEIPASWDVSSDSLAAWLAGQLGAPRLLLVKQVELPASLVRLQDLVVQGVLDAAFPRFAQSCGAAIAIAGPRAHTQAAAAIGKGEMAGALLELC
jgi:dihydroneopterin aldolase